MRSSFLRLPSRVVRPRALFPRTRVRLATWISIFLIIGAGLTVYQAIRTQDAAWRWVVHTREVLDQLAAVQATLDEAESGQRGYLLSGEPAFLGAFNDAPARLRGHIQALSELTSDNPQQQWSLHELKPMVERRLALLDSVLARAGSQASITSEALLPGLQTMQAVRVRLSQMRAEEERLLAERTSAAEHARFRSNVATLGLAVLALVLVTLIRTFAIADAAAVRASEERLAVLNRELEQRVVDRTRALQDANAGLEAFSYSVSHDLRAPLRAIGGFAEALLEDHGAALNDSAREDLHRIMLAAERMETLIEDLLAYARVSRADLRPSVVKVAEVVHAALEVLGGDIAARRAVVEVHSTELAVRADRTTLTQAIENLVANAIKFVAPGVTPQVRITFSRDDGQVRLEVADNGIGVDERHRERIFQVFERLHGADIYPGTGIGLAIVRKGIERMGGTVGLRAAPRGGSVFWISLPAAEGKAS
jgi:signal transduction histidine kinase